MPLSELFVVFLWCLFSLSKAVFHSLGRSSSCCLLQIQSAHPHRSALWAKKRKFIQSLAAVPNLFIAEARLGKTGSVTMSFPDNISFSPPLTMGLPLSPSTCYCWVMGMGLCPARLKRLHSIPQLLPGLTSPKRYAIRDHRSRRLKKINSANSSGSIKEVDTSILSSRAQLDEEQGIQVFLRKTC